MAELVVVDVGRAGYDEALALQRRLVQQVQEAHDEQAYLVLVEHDPPVITLGRGADVTHVLGSPAQLAAEGIEIRETTRGGDVTYHGPGQLVGYPILRVDRHGRDVHGYLRALEEVLIRLLAPLGIEGQRRQGLTGVWVGQAKVAAIGIAIRRWVSYHGFSLNVSPNLSHFEWIVPCGLTDKPVTSLSRLLGRSISMAEVKSPLIECMVQVFAFEGTRDGSI